MKWLAVRSNDDAPRKAADGNRRRGRLGGPAAQYDSAAVAHVRYLVASPGARPLAR